MPTGDTLARLLCLRDERTGQQRRTRHGGKKSSTTHDGCSPVPARILAKMLGYDKAHQRPSDELAEFRGARQPIGRTKRGMNTKLYGVSDADGRPLSVFMTPDRSATT
ncbi:hypothetical protein ACLBWH_01310 [Sphingomonas sp. M6A6_1c]